MRHTRHRAITLSLIGIQLAGCVAWTPAPGSPREVLEAERPDVVRVTDADGVRTKIWYPEMRGDTLTGADAGVRVPLGDVRAMEVGDFRGQRTVATVTLVTLGVIAVISAIVHLSWDTSKT